MTTVASDLERIEELDAMAAREWAAYGARLRDLHGIEYDIAEAEAWDVLQRALEPLQDERSTLVDPDRDTPDIPS